MVKASISQIVYGDYLQIATKIAKRTGSGRILRLVSDVQMLRDPEKKSDNYVMDESGQHIDRIIDRSDNIHGYNYYVIERIPHTPDTPISYDTYRQEGFMLVLDNGMLCKVYKQTKFVKDDPSIVHIGEIYIIFELDLGVREITDADMKYVADTYASIYGNYVSISGEEEDTISSLASRDIPIEVLTIRGSTALNFKKFPYTITPKVDGLSGRLYIINRNGDLFIYVKLRDSRRITLASRMPGMTTSADAVFLVEVFKNKVTKETEYFIVDMLYSSIIGSYDLVQRRRNMMTLLQELIGTTGAKSVSGSFSQYIVIPRSGIDLTSHILPITLWTHRMKVIERDPYDNFMKFWQDVDNPNSAIPLDRGLSVVLYPVNSTVENLGSINRKVYKIKSPLDNTHDSVISDQIAKISIYNKGAEDALMPFVGSKPYPCNPQVEGVTSNYANMVCEVSILKPDDMDRRDAIENMSLQEALAFYAAIDSKANMSKRKELRTQMSIDVEVEVLGVRTKPFANNMSTAISNYNLYMDEITTGRILGNTSHRIQSMIEEYMSGALSGILRTYSNLSHVIIVYPMGRIDHLIEVMELQLNTPITVVFNSAADLDDFSKILIKSAPINEKMWNPTLDDPTDVINGIRIKRASETPNPTVDTLVILPYSTMQMTPQQWPKVVEAINEFKSDQHLAAMVWMLDFYSLPGQTGSYNKLGLEVELRKGKSKSGAVTSKLSITTMYGTYTRVGIYTGEFNGKKARLLLDVIGDDSLRERLTTAEQEYLRLQTVVFYVDTN